MTQLKIDNSQLKDFRQCPRMWAFKHQDKLALSDETTRVATPLAFGGAIHKGLDELYESYDVDLAVEAFKEAYEYDPLWADKVRTPQRGEEMLRSYARFSVDFMGNLDLLAKEHYFEFPLGVVEVKETEDPVEVTYVGVIDKVILDKRFNKVTGIDHKTTSRMMSSWLQAIRISNQFKGYLYYLRHHSPWAAEVSNMFWIDVLSTAKTSSNTESNIPFHRESLLCDDGQLLEWKELTLETVKMMLGMQVPVMNTDSCDAYMRLCSFYDICSSPVEMRETVIGLNYVEVEPWDPKNRD